MKGFIFCIFPLGKGFASLLYLMSSYLYLALISTLQFSCLSPFHLYSYCWVHVKASIFYSQNVSLIPTAREQTGALTRIAWLFRKQGCMVRNCSRQEYTTGCAMPFPEGKSLPLPKQSKSKQPVLLPHCCLEALPWGRKTGGWRWPGNAEFWLTQQAASTLCRQGTDLGQLQAPLSNLLDAS